MRKSKYIGFKSGNWTCVHLGIARVQPAFTHKYGIDGKRQRSVNQNQTYYYIFERPTSDGKAIKMVRLNANQASQVYKNEITVEELAEKKAIKRSQEFKEKVSYSFCD